MNVEQIEELWDKDCRIDQSNLIVESLKIPELHNKYYKIYIREKAAVAGLTGQLKELQRIKHEYYMGTLDVETLKERGWEPFQRRLLKDSVGLYLDSDRDIIALSTKIDMQKEKVAFLDSVLRMVTNRGFQVKNAIDMIKFENGSI